MDFTPEVLEMIRDAFVYEYSKGQGV